MKNKRLFLILFAGIILLGAILRFSSLKNYPPGLYPDEAVNATDGLRALSQNDLKIYYPNNNGREGLYINLLAISFRLFGISIESFRAVSALIGTLTVLAVYLLAKEMFGRTAGLVASFLVATSFWHLNFSRIGFRAILVPLLLSFSFYFLIKGYKNLPKDFIKNLRTKANLYFLISGLIFGIGFHTYIAFRIAPAIILVFFLLFFLVDKKNSGSFKKSFKRTCLPFFAFIIGTFITALPIIYFFLTNPELLSARQNDNSISVLDPRNQQGGLIISVGKTFAQTFGQFFWKGDMNWRHNLPPNPQLSPFVSLMFLLGILFALVSFIKKFIELFFTLFVKRKKIIPKPSCPLGCPFLKLLSQINISNDKFIFYGFTLAWFFIMLSPAFLTVEGLPHSLRSIGSLPAAFLISALPLAFVLNLKPQNQRNKRLKYFLPAQKILIYCALLLTLLYNTLNYFAVWGRKTDTAHAFEKTQVNIGNYLKNETSRAAYSSSDPASSTTLPENREHYYVIVNIDSKTISTGFPVSLETIRFFNFDSPNITYFKLDEVDQIQIDPADKYSIIIQRSDSQLMNELTEKFNLRAEKIELSPQFEDTDFIVLKNY